MDYITLYCIILYYIMTLYVAVYIIIHDVSVS